MIVPVFFWKWEPVKKDRPRFYHTSDKCPEGRRIPVIERDYGFDDHEFCPTCLKLNRRGQ